MIAADHATRTAAARADRRTSSSGQRQRAIRELDRGSRRSAASARLVDALAAQGFEVTQATVSRDIAELGLVKVPGADRPRLRHPRADRRVERRRGLRTSASSASSPTSRSRSAAAG
mgnify:CR=1 FL=1